MPTPEEEEQERLRRRALVDEYLQSAGFGADREPPATPEPIPAVTQPTQPEPIPTATEPAEPVLAAQQPQQQVPPVAAPPPAAAQAPAPAQMRSTAELSDPDQDARAWALLGDRTPSYPDYTPKSGAGILGDNGAEWAALLDVALNRGRGVGQILGAAAQVQDKRQQQALDAEMKRAQIDWYKRRQSGGTSPEELELRRQSLGLRAQGLQLSKDREQRLIGEAARRLQETTAKYGSGSPQVRQVIDYYQKLGVPLENLPDANATSMDAMKVMAPTVRQQGQIAQATPIALAAGQKAAAQEAGRLDSRHIQADQQNADAANRAAAIESARLPYVQEHARLQASGTQMGQGDYRERKLRYEMANKFAKDNDDMIQLQGLITEIGHTPAGAVPQGWAERFGDVIKGWGMDPTRIEPWQAKQMVLEKWSRSQSGAAISMTEDERFKLQAGASRLASPEQVEAAYNVLGRVVQRHLRAAATNNPEAAKVLFNSGTVDDVNSFLGQSDDEIESSARNQAAQAPYDPARVPAPRTNGAPSPVLPPRNPVVQGVSAQGLEPVPQVNEVLPKAPAPALPTAPATKKKTNKVEDDELEGL